jgi:UDP-glucuronate decarboxylase
MITLAKAKLNWEPTVPLRDGLIRTIEYFRSHPGVLPA